MTNEIVDTSDNLTRWLHEPYTTEQITTLRNKLLFWSFLSWVLALSNVEVTTMLFIRFVDPVSKEQLLPVTLLITCYYFVFWLTRLIEYWMARNASAYLVRFLDLETSLNRVVGNTGILDQEEREAITGMIPIYKKGKERVHQSKFLSLLVFLIFDIIVPSVIFFSALITTYQQFFNAHN